MSDGGKRKYFTRRTISNMMVIAFGVVFYMFWQNYALCVEKLRMFFGIVSPFIWAFAIAFFLNMPVKWLEAKVFSGAKYKRALAVAVTYALVGCFISGVLFIVLPDVIAGVLRLIENAPQYIVELEKIVYELAQNLQLDIESTTALIGTWEEILVWLVGMLPQLLDISFAVGSGVVNSLMAIIVSIYMLMSKDISYRQSKKAVYALFEKEKAERVIELAIRSQRIFLGFVNGKALSSLIVGGSCYIFLTLAGFEYIALITVLVGITNMIPFFGPFIGAIPSIMILLTVDPWQALWFTVWIIILQQIDGNILTPRIVGNITGLSPMWVLLGIVVGGGLFGVIGMILGVPAFAVLYSVVSDYLGGKLKEKGIDLYGKPIKEDAKKQEVEK